MPIVSQRFNMLSDETQLKEKEFTEIKTKRPINFPAMGKYATEIGSVFLSNGSLSKLYEDYKDVFSTAISTLFSNMDFGLLDGLGDILECANNGDLFSIAGCLFGDSVDINFNSLSNDILGNLNISFLEQYKASYNRIRSLSTNNTFSNNNTTNAKWLVGLARSYNPDFQSSIEQNNKSISTGVGIGTIASKLVNAGESNVYNQLVSTLTDIQSKNIATDILVENGIKTHNDSIIESIATDSSYTNTSSNTPISPIKQTFPNISTRLLLTVNKQTSLSYITNNLNTIDPEWVSKSTHTSLLDTNSQNTLSYIANKSTQSLNLNTEIPYSSRLEIGFKYHISDIKKAVTDYKQNLMVL